MSKQLSWPVSDPAVEGCDAQAIASISIFAGAAHAPYSDPDKKPTDADIAFWERVRAERERIAAWVVDGLGISGRAK